MSLSRGPDVAGLPGTPFTNAASRIDGDRAAYAILEDGRLANHRNGMRLFVNLQEGRVADPACRRCNGPASMNRAVHESHPKWICPGSAIASDQDSRFFLASGGRKAAGLCDEREPEFGSRLGDRLVGSPEQRPSAAVQGLSKRDAGNRGSPHLAGGRLRFARRPHVPTMKRIQLRRQKITVECLSWALIDAENAGVAVGPVVSCPLTAPHEPTMAILYSPSLKTNRDTQYLSRPPFPSHLLSPSPRAP